jgi:hypothetical protein
VHDSEHGPTEPRVPALTEQSLARGVQQLQAAVEADDEHTVADALEHSLCREHRRWLERCHMVVIDRIPANSIQQFIK